MVAVFRKRKIMGPTWKGGGGGPSRRSPCPLPSSFQNLLTLHLFLHSPPPFSLFSHQIMSDSASPPPRTLFPILLGLIPTTTAGSRPNQIVVLDHAARTVLLFEVLDHDASEKPGPLPASKASIDAMPKVGVTKLGIDCAICLDGFEVGEDARQMPCKHVYHSDCIEKWLGVSGTCPVCRFAMPVHDHDHDDMEGGEGRVVVVNLWVNDGESLDVESGSGHGSEDSDSESDPSSESSFSFSSFFN